MDATCRKVLGLISEMNVRFVVPVYQRPYSWDEEQCLQLWDDVLSCGRHRDVPHFTGSIVTIQDGEPSEAGVAPLLLIDGQQRITTVTLMLIALARYADRHSAEELSFSRDEIVLSGYLTNHFRQGDDHYKLTMSKGDRAVYRQLIDSLEDPSAPAPTDDSARLLQNLGLFERRLEALKDVDSVWAGLKRLEVVSVSLTQGQDNPQLIFESMNSTGKDLSCADLVRNYVLMDAPMASQQDVYHAYWEPIEHILGAGTLEGNTYDAAFEDFIRCYLTSVWAPTSFARGDAYQAFKRYIQAKSYDRDGRIRDFSLRLKRYARHFAAITGGACEDTELSEQLRRIDALGVTAVRPLELTLLNERDQHVFGRADLLGMLATLESYLMRRSACELESSVLPSFFSSLIARLDAVRASEGDYVTAFYAMLVNEGDTPCRFPTDEEFSRALCTRDAFFWHDAPTLLARIDQGRERPAGDLAGYRPMHVMPPRALGSEAWRPALGEGPAARRAFDGSVNTLGNLTSACSAFDPQDGSLEQKQQLLAGEAGPALAISADVLAAKAWGPEEIAARSQALADEALEIWAYPTADEEACRLYRRRRDSSADVTFADLFQAGLVRAGDRLVSADPMYPGSATVTFDGQMMLEDGQMCYTPADAFEKLLVMDGAEPVRRNGWLCWRRGEGGPLLDELREVLL